MSENIYSDQIIVSCPLVYDENGYYHLVYKITNTKNGKIYIGKHSTKDPYDNYFGSGKAIKQALKISKAHSGKKHTQETKDKMSKAHSGANSSQAKCILKIDDSGNIVAEYSCKKDCREQEHISVYMLDKLLKERILYNGFYFEYKSKN